MNYNPYQVYRSELNRVRVRAELPHNILFCQTINGERLEITVEFFEKYYEPVISCVSCRNEYHHEDVANGDWIDQNQCLWICVNCCCCSSCHHICWKYDTYEKCECPRDCPSLTPSHVKPDADFIRNKLNDILSAAQDLRIIQVQLLGLVDSNNQAWQSDADRAWNEINRAHRALYMKLLGNEE